MFREIEEEEDFAQAKVRCVGAHPICGALSQRGLAEPIIMDVLSKNVRRFSA